MTDTVGGRVGEEGGVEQREIGVKREKADGETANGEMMQPAGKLLPRAIVCCV